MSKRKIPGLYYQNGQWVIDKRVQGYGRVFERTGIRERGAEQAAKARLEKRIREIEDCQRRERNEEQPEFTFRQAATRYLKTSKKRSIDRDALALEKLDPFIGDLEVPAVHMGTLQPYIDARAEAGIRSATITRELAVVRRILKLCARVYRDEKGRPWLRQAPPLLDMPKWEDDAKPPLILG